MGALGDVNVRGSAMPGGLAPLERAAADGREAERGAAVAAGEGLGAGPDYLDSIRLGDCVTLMAELPAQCVDLVITDPPFAIDFKAARANYNRTGSRVIEGYKEIEEDDYLVFTKAWLSQATRLLKNSGSMYVFSGWNHLKDLLTAIDACGLVTVNHLIWKYQFGVVTTRKYVTSHYHCLYVCKDDAARKFRPYARFGKEAKNGSSGSAHYKDKEDVWEIQREYWHGDLKTPTKLPAEIIRKILAYSSDEGDIVLDPFLGSGQVAVVSKMEGRRYIGFELAHEYYEFALDRITTGQYRVAAQDTRASENPSPDGRLLSLWG